MRALLSLVVGALLVLALVLWLWRSDRPSPSPASANPPAELEAHSSAPSIDLTPVASTPQQERVAETSTRTSVSTSPRCRVIGRVVDDRGAPLAKETVILSPTQSGWIHGPLVDAKDGAERHGWISATTGDDGKFAIDAPLPSGKDVVLAIEPDEFHAFVEVSFGPSEKRPKLIAGDNDVGDIALATCGVAEGRVVAGDGGTVENAVVYVTGSSNHGESTKTPGWMAEVEPNGHYRLGHMPVGSMRFDVFAETWTRKRGISVDVRAGVVTSVPNIVLERAFVIAGTVVDENGVGLDRIMIRSKQANSDGPAGPTHADGTFTLSLTREDPCVVTIDAPGFELWGGGPDATFARSTLGVRIVLQRSPILTFHVIDADTRAPIERFGFEVVDAPLADRAEEMDGASLALADHPGGNATWTSLRDKFVLHVVAPDHADEEALVVPDPDDSHVQTLALRHESRIRGRLVLGGKPVAGADLRLGWFIVDPSAIGSTRIKRLGNNAFLARTRAAISNADGEFRFEGLSPATCALQIDAPRAARKLLTKLAIPVADVLQLGEVALDASATVHGSLTVGATESLHDFVATIDMYRRVEVDVDGRFTFTGLGSGTHTVSWARTTPVSWTDPTLRGQKIELVSGETREVTLDASGSAPCTLTVHMLHDGRPTSGVQVLVRHHTHDRHDAWEEQTLAEKPNEPGTCEGFVDGDLAVELLAVDHNARILGQISPQVQPSPSGRIELMYTLATGTLVVELPDSLVLPDKFVAKVRLELATHEVRYASMGVYARLGSVTGPDHHIEMGEVGCGTFEATLTLQRRDSGASGDGYVDIRAPYKTSVTIEPGHETKIVVP